MYKIGDLIVYENKGICRVEDIEQMASPSSKEKQDYYVLKPVYDQSSTIYSAVNNTKVHVRPIMSKEEAEELIREIPEIPSLKINDEKEREAKYREAMFSCDGKQWVSAIKTLYTRRQNRLVQGKKTTNTDDRYYKMAGENLHGELAMALGIEKSEMEQHITDTLHSLGLVTAENS